MALKPKAGKTNNSREDVFSYSRKATLIYGREVLYNRAIPSLQDGLKPVHRYIGWTAYHELGLKATGQYTKCARVVGDTMGRYHPHNDLSIYHAMITMSKANSNMPIIDGEGNFGSQLDSAASSRYTECRLTAYAMEHMLHPDYLAVIPMEPNYDDTLQSPMWLPARLPHVLFSNAIGIAVAATTNIPPFAPKGVIALCKMLAEGEKLNEQVLLKHLKFDYYTGCDLWSKPKEVMKFLRNGKGGLVYGSRFDVQGSEICVLGLPPQFNWDSVVVRLTETGFFSSIYEDTEPKTGKPCIRLTLKRGTKYEDAETILHQCFSCTVNHDINVNIRTAAGSIEFNHFPVLEMFKVWYAYRKQLEIASLKYQIGLVQHSTRRNELLLLAIKSADRLVALIRKKYASREVMTQAVAKLLKISFEDAQYVLTLTLGRLSSLDKEEVESKIAQLLLDEKKLKLALSKPDATLAGFFASAKI